MGTTGKPFLTVEQQVDLLESRGMKTDERTGPVLLREGYYQVVNGYKEPFLDAGAGPDQFAGARRSATSIRCSDSTATCVR